jgi:hypothetical protein
MSQLASCQGHSIRLSLTRSSTRSFGPVVIGQEVVQVHSVRLSLTRGCTGSFDPVVIGQEVVQIHSIQLSLTSGCTRPFDPVVIDKELYRCTRSSCHWTRSCTNPFDPVVIDDIGAASGFGAPIGIQTDACPRHPEDCGLWRFHKCGITAGRSASAYAAAFPEKARKRSVWLPSARGFFVPLKVLASRWVLADFHKPDRSNGGGLDNFTYTANDGAGGTADTTLTVVVTAPGITYLGGTANTTIDGGNNVHEVLDGGAGNDVVIAGTGTQVLIGGPGDTLTGGHGADTFVFLPNFGNETITNFDVHHDTIQLPHSEFANIATVLADIHQVGANVQIAPDAHDVITLNNLSAAQLHASNFHLV